jgi:hypothetical protein
MGPLTPRLDSLPPEQRRLWPDLRPAAELGFVLYGGTAIALRLGHRTSVDFDFFRSQPLDRAQMRAALPFTAMSAVLQDEPDAFTILVRGEEPEAAPVKVSFFGGIGFGRIGAPDLTDDGVLRIASMDDLMATKLKVMLQRVEAKDYRDIAAMIRAGAPGARPGRRRGALRRRLPTQREPEGSGVFPRRRPRRAFPGRQAMLAPGGQRGARPARSDYLVARAGPGTAKSIGIAARLRTSALTSKECSWRRTTSTMTGSTTPSWP